MSLFARGDQRAAGRKQAFHDLCPCPCLADPVPVPVPVPDLDLDLSRGHDGAVMAVRARDPIVAVGVVRLAQRED